MQLNQNNYLGLVLAGGKSRRMGRDKALLPFAKQGEATLFDYVLRRFENQINDIVISTPSQHHVFTSCGHKLLPDKVAFSGFGPLSGLKAAFDYCHDIKPFCPYLGIITIAVDTPFFPDNYVKRMCEAAVAQPGMAGIAATIKGFHPTFALWPLNLLDKLETHIETGERSIKSFAERIGAQIVTFPLSCTLMEDPFFNINTQEEWRLAKQHSECT